MRKLAQGLITFFLFCCAISASSMPQWLPLNLSEASAVIELVSSPESDGVVYASAFRAGLFRSANGGQHWTSLGRDFYDLVVIDDNCVWGKSYDSETKIVSYYHSIDAGVHWQIKHLDGKDISDIKRVSATLVYALTKSSLYVSLDGSQHWQKRAELPFSGAKTVSVVGPDHVFVVTDDNSSSDGKSHLFASHNGGKTWQELSTQDMKDSLRTLYPKTDKTLFASTGTFFYRSTDGGKTWVDVSPEHDYYTITAVAVSHDGQVYVLNDGLLFKSNDDGNSWVQVGKGTLHHWVDAFTVNKEAVYVAASMHGIYKSRDDGGSWQAVYDGMNAALVSDLTVDNHGTIFAAADGGLYQRSLGDADWTQSTTEGWDGGNMTLLTSTPSGNVFVHALGQGIFESGNEGNSWQEKFKEPETSDRLTLHLLATSDSTIYDVPKFGGPSLKSNDGGNTWHAFSEPNQGERMPQGFDALNDNDIYLSDDIRAYHSADGGHSWQALADFPITHSYQDNQLTVIDNLTFFVVFSYSGVYKTIDGGKSWFKSSEGLPQYPSGYYCDLQTIVAKSPNELYLGSKGQGVYQSLDGGQTWQSFNQGLNHLGVVVLKIKDQTLYAGLDGGGVYQLQLSE